MTSITALILFGVLLLTPAALIIGVQRKPAMVRARRRPVRRVRG